MGPRGVALVFSVLVFYLFQVLRLVAVTAFNSIAVV
jgi:hypothetical protein